jgi:hypothetical protein
MYPRSMTVIYLDTYSDTREALTVRPSATITLKVNGGDPYDKRPTASASLVSR